MWNHLIICWKIDQKFERLNWNTGTLRWARSIILKNKRNKMVNFFCMGAPIHSFLSNSLKMLFFPDSNIWKKIIIKNTFLFKQRYIKLGKIFNKFWDYFKICIRGYCTCPLSWTRVQKLLTWKDIGHAKSSLCKQDANMGRFVSHYFNIEFMFKCELVDKRGL